MVVENGGYLDCGKQRVQPWLSLLGALCTEKKRRGEL